MMTIDKICENLQNTIAGKEMFLEEINRSLDKNKSGIDAIVSKTTAEFLEINLAELRMILKDVEECISENA